MVEVEEKYLCMLIAPEIDRQSLYMFFASTTSQTQTCLFEGLVVITNYSPSPSADPLVASCSFASHRDCTPALTQALEIHPSSPRASALALKGVMAMA